MKPKIYIGTSGWSYGHWKENFYPEKLATKHWLSFYSQAFSTVEINTTFYHIPKLSYVNKWYADVPKDFLFSIKASRYITHQKRLHDCEDSLQVFYSSIQPLKNKIGPILFQLPPSFKSNKDLLVEFCKLLDPKYLYTFEFRHSTWFDEEIYDVLKKKKIALCITDLNGKLSPEVVTSSFVYLRLHGPKKAYSGSYGTRRLHQWKKKIEQWRSQVSVYCYFDNDEKGYAIEDARTLKGYFDKE